MNNVGLYTVNLENTSIFPLLASNEVWTNEINRKHPQMRWRKIVDGSALTHSQKKLVVYIVKSEKQIRREAV